ncbi:MAG: hypothetical protein AB2708_00545, partial [Candidatus Thiodiazotropha taylori]
PLSLLVHIKSTVLIYFAEAFALQNFAEKNVRSFCSYVAFALLIINVLPATLLPYCTQSSQNLKEFWPVLSALGLID